MRQCVRDSEPRVSVFPMWPHASVKEIHAEARIPANRLRQGAGGMGLEALSNRPRSGAEDAQASCLVQQPQAADMPTWFPMLAELPRALIG